VALLVDLGVLGLALAGHAALWLGLANRLHGTGLDRWTVKVWTWAMRLVLLCVPVVFAALLFSYGPLRSWGQETAAGNSLPPNWASLAIFYLAFCLIIDAIYFPLWLRDRLRQRPALLSSRSELVSLAERLGTRPVVGLPTTLLSRLPGNELLTLEVVDRSLEIARLPPQLDGLSLVHLTDLHFSGRVSQAYFHEAVRIVNAWQPDLVLVTGDICEKARFIPWVEEILGPIESRLGKFFVLGNHDVRTHDVPRLRSTLSAAGFTDLSGVWSELSIDGAWIVLGGDERPWLGEPLDPRQAPPRPPDTPELRLVLLHTPDRLSVARAADADLALAGHTHAGQIRMPWIGAIVCPSWYGMRYDAGLFHFPPTTMYVGRGLSCLTPLRFNCPAELTRLVLRRPGAKPEPGI
jgi:predicted MPP superfamily phosphohydrolase